MPAGAALRRNRAALFILGDTMFFYFIAAIIVLIAYGWFLRKINRDFHAFRKERFERTNSAGVLEFATYEDLRAFEKREGYNQLWINIAAVPGGIVPLIAIFVIIGSIAQMIS